MTRKTKVVWSVFALLVIIFLSGFFWVRGRGFSAKETPSGLEEYFARNLRRISTPSDAVSLKNPRDQTDKELAPAYEHYIEHCAVCHGASGKGDSIYGPNMYPKVPDLTKNSTQELSDGELYYIITNGVRFTGMPAFGGQDKPEEIWDIVSLIRKFPTITPQIIDRYQNYKEGVIPPPKQQFQKSTKSEAKPHKH